MTSIKQALWLGMALLLLTQSAWAQQGRSLRLIRDAEIEDLLRDYARPLFQAGGLNNDAIRITLVVDDRFNAFVAGGQRIFLHTGLLQKTTQPEQVAGVIAHEAGHIAGGHLSRMHSNMENASTAMILSYILGAAAAVGSGNAGAGAAVLSGANNVAMRNLLRYSRAQEQAADQFGVQVMEKAGWSAKGLADAMTLISRESLWRGRTDTDPYARSHPLTDDRIRFFEHELTKKGERYPASIVSLRVRHARMRGKLQGFLGEPQTILLALQREPAETTPEGKIRQQYARAIALYRLPDEQEALEAIKPLAQQFPADPYLIELHAQMALERGDVALARDGYAKALQLLPGQPLLQLGLANALLAGKRTADQTTQAVTLLERVTQQDADMLDSWRLLAQAYGEQGQNVAADVALAEIAWRQRDREKFDFLMARVERGLGQGASVPSRTRLHFQDLQKAAEEWEEERETPFQRRG